MCLNTRVPPEEEPEARMEDERVHRAGSLSSGLRTQRRPMTVKRRAVRVVAPSGAALCTTST